jgi:hypothetical protein
MVHEKIEQRYKHRMWNIFYFEMSYIIQKLLKNCPTSVIKHHENFGVRHDLFYKIAYPISFYGCHIKVALSFDTVPTFIQSKRSKSELYLSSNFTIGCNNGKDKCRNQVSDLSQLYQFWSRQ